MSEYLIPISAAAAATRVANPDAIRAVEGNLMETAELFLSAVRAAAPHILAAEHDNEAAWRSSVATELAAKGMEYRELAARAAYHRERAAQWRRIASGEEVQA